MMIQSSFAIRVLAIKVHELPGFHTTTSTFCDSEVKYFSLFQKQLHKLTIAGWIPLLSFKGKEISRLIFCMYFPTNGTATIPGLPATFADHNDSGLNKRSILMSFQKKQSRRLWISRKLFCRQMVWVFGVLQTNERSTIAKVYQR